MRKVLLVAIISLSTILFFTSCFNMNPDNIDNSDTENNLEYIALNSEEVRETDIIVEGGINVGTLSFWTKRSVDTGNMELHILIELKNGWELNETYIGTKTSPYPVIVDYTTLKNHFYGTGASEEKFVLDLGNLPEETEGIYFAIYSIFKKYGFVKKASGPCKYYVPFAGDPELGVNVESKINATKEIVYDWEISKVVEPEAMELEEGESGKFNYTLVATRTKVNEINDYSASGTLTVFNTGPVEDPGVVATVTIQYYDGEWKELKEEGIIGTPGISIEASNTTGYDYPFTITFDPGSYNDIRILAKAKDAYSYMAEDNNDHNISGLTPNIIDESASVIDGFTNLVDFEGEGFTVENDASWPWELDDVVSGKTSYIATITNAGAPQGLYSLTNKATLTENDSLATRTDNARILITVPEPQEDEPSIDASVVHSVDWERETKYDWEIEKEVVPTSVTLDKDESADLKYTILATRLEPTLVSTYTISGRATATNDGHVDLMDVVIGVSFDSQEATSVIGNLSAGGEVGFDFTFKTNSEFDPFTVTVNATGTSGVEVTDTDSNDAYAPELPTPDTIEDATATIEDEVTNLPTGFTLDPNTTNRNWDITEPSKEITYQVTLENDEAGPGTYYLTNLATLTENDTKEERSDDATVTIDVPSSDISAEVSANVEWERELEYDWTLTKEVEPTEATLDKGESVNLTYTLTAERDEGETKDSTYTIKGQVVVENNGAGNATGVDVDVELVDPNTTKTLVTGDNIASGGSKTYEFTFITKTYKSSYDINAEVTADVGGDTDSTTANTPNDPATETIIDEESSIEDIVTNLPTGFTLDPNTTNRNWDITEPSKEITYQVTLENDEAGPGTYYLTNLATLTENDTKEERSDNATVTITVPSYVDLDAEVNVDVKWEEEIIYDWMVEKTVDPTEVTLPVGESVLLDYTITATRNIASSDSTYTISGTVKVTNSGNVGAAGVNVDVELDETGDTKNLVTGDSIPVNDSETYDFEFVTKNYHSSYKVIATITANDHPEVTKDETKNTPVVPENGKYFDKTATVEDNTTYIPAGFSISPSTTNRTWSLNNTETLFYSITLTNDSYYTYQSLENFIMLDCCVNDKLEVLNEVVLTEDDSGDTHDDDAKVIIYVPECKSETAWGEGFDFPGSNWAMYFYLSPSENSTTVSLIAAQHYDVGEVKAEWTTYNNESAVKITYKTDSGFKMAEIHTDIVYDPNEWPDNPAPGLFETNVSFYSDPINEYSFIQANRDRNNGVYIAAHAVVTNCDGAFEE